MKILYLFRECYESKYILSQLEKRKLVEEIIIETGTAAKKEKVINISKKANLLSYPKILLDVLAIVSYSTLVTNKLKKRLGVHRYPNDKVKLCIKDANDISCIDFIKKNHPDVIFIYGTAILKERFLAKSKSLIINIHSGIVPKYRNVHSDFWAFINRDYSNIGVSLIILDKGIDSGKVVLQKKIKVEKKDSLIDVKTKILNTIPALVETVIKRSENKRIAAKEQDIRKVGFHKTPGIFDLVRLLYNHKHYDK